MKVSKMVMHGQKHRRHIISEVRQLNLIFLYHLAVITMTYDNG